MNDPAADGGERQYSYWDACTKSYRPCPACGGQRWHGRRCPIFKKKAVACAFLIGIPLVVAAIVANGPIVILYVVVGAIMAVAFVLRRRAFAELARGSGSTDDQD